MLPVGSCNFRILTKSENSTWLFHCSFSLVVRFTSHKWHYAISSLKYSYHPLVHYVTICNHFRRRLFSTGHHTRTWAMSQSSVNTKFLPAVTHTRTQTCLSYAKNTMGYCASDAHAKRSSCLLFFYFLRRNEQAQNVKVENVTFWKSLEAPRLETSHCSH